MGRRGATVGTGVTLGKGAPFLAPYNTERQRASVGTTATLRVDVPGRPYQDNFVVFRRNHKSFGLKNHPPLDIDAISTLLYHIAPP